MTNILLTGAFGNVGVNTLKHLAQQQYTIFAFDVRNSRNEKLAAYLGKSLHFTPIWGDLRNEASVKTAVQQAQPAAILHVAAVIAPTAYIIPNIAHDVNINGARYLINAAEQLDQPAHFIFTSTYTVHGPRNPYKNLPPLTADTPLNPSDNYGRHKVAIEQMIQASSLPWTIIRLPAVLPTSTDFGRSSEFIKFSFLLPMDRREHLIDSRDAALALVNAIDNDAAIGRIFNIGGPEVDCRVTGAEMMRTLGEARGVAIPQSAYRTAHPDVDESWYFEDWVDTSESQRVLQYQQHTLADYLAYMHQQSGWQRHLLRLFQPLIRRYILKESPYYGKPVTPDPTPMAQLIRDTFNMPNT